MYSFCEYIWTDGAKPTVQLRSKTKVMQFQEKPSVKDFPVWSFDGSSTYQSEGGNSDLQLRPVHVVSDPIRGSGNYLVMCEVEDDDGRPHPTNTRAQLRKALDAGGSQAEPWFGFEQEYTLLKDGHPYGWPQGGFPAPQGPFYCGVGPSQVYGRDLVEAHTKACIEAGIMLYGTNAEVMPAQWEYQIGPRGFASDTHDALALCDQHWLARWLLHRVAEDYGVQPSFENKPIKGDWNGAGQHTNFSTKEMRSPETGRDAIERAIGRLGERHKEHVAVYGAGLSDRLTGEHETCSINEFRSGVADRGASIRIPRAVADQGYGYLEDRRPGANADPYAIASCLVETVCGVSAS